MIVNKKKKPSTPELIAYVFSGLMMVVLGFWSFKSQIFPKLSVALKDVCSRNQLYFATEAGFGVSFELILPRKRCKIIIYFAVIAL